MLKVRFATIGLSVALGLSMVAPASAVTIAELQAQINALMAQLASLQGSSAPVATYTFNTDLTVGSKGAAVTSLQQYLVGQGHLVMPVGVSYSYFGSLTKAAVMKWQAANGVSATGYFGPISRAKANSSGAVATVPGSVGGVIGTPGVEGTITVSLNPTPASAKLYEDDSNRDVLGVKLEAKTSDIKIERLKLKLDEASDSTTNDTDFYRKIAGKIYVKDGSTVLASMDLNINTVVKDGSDYFITLSGFGFVVPKGSTKVLTVALDAKSQWDSAFDGDSWTVIVPVEGVRGIDGAGVNQYGPSTAFSRNFTSEGQLSESATLTVSTNTNTPQDMDVIAAQGSSENEYDGLEVLKVDFKAEKDDVTITDLVVDIVRGGTTTTATATTAYLYDGSSLVGSASVAGTSATLMGATFADIDYLVSKNSTKTLTVKLDIDTAGTAFTSFTVDIDTADVTAENAAGTGITESGSATGETINVRSVGLEVSLVSKSITKSATASQNNYSTSTAEATFVLRLKAVGGDIIVGDAGSTTVPFASNGTQTGTDGGPSFLIYRGGSAVTTSGASSSSMTVPSGVVSVTANSFTLQEGNTVDVPVSFLFEGRASTGALVTTGSYAIGIAQLNWVSSAGVQESNFMSGNAAWRTSTVSLP